MTLGSARRELGRWARDTDTSHATPLREGLPVRESAPLCLRSCCCSSVLKSLPALTCDRATGFSTVSQLNRGSRRNAGPATPFLWSKDLGLAFQASRVDGGVIFPAPDSSAACTSKRFRSWNEGHKGRLQGVGVPRVGQRLLPGGSLGGKTQEMRKQHRTVQCCSQIRRKHTILPKRCSSSSGMHSTRQTQRVGSDKTAVYS